MSEPSLKNSILDIIYEEVEKWSSQEKFYCSEGCATCCTRNVIITALEAERILDFCIKNNLRSWIVDKLTHLSEIEKLQQTTNEYILDTLENREKPDTILHPTEVCPFLDENLCGIYPVRPFSCRCFSSQTLCSNKKTALVSDHYFYGSMAVMQIIEHLGQFEYYGYMTDVLLALIKTKKYEAFSSVVEVAQLDYKRNVLQAQPIPGFITPEDVEQQIKILLNSIFKSSLNNKTIEQILNGQ